MSVRTDGTRRCDRCGVDVGNGSVIDSVRVSDLARDEAGTLRVGAPLLLDFCRVNGCDKRVLSSRALANWKEDNP